MESKIQHKFFFVQRQTAALFLVSLLALTTVSFAAASSGEGSLAQLVGNANNHYTNGEFLQAAEAYKKAVSAGADNGHIYYNLANAQYRLELYGAAIANFRRALAQFPRDPDIRANLSLAREHAVDKIEIKKENVLPYNVNSLLSPGSQLSKYEKEQLFFLFYALFWFAFLYNYLKKTGLAKTIAAFCFLAGLYFGILAYGTVPGYKGEPQLALTPAAHKYSSAVVTIKEASIYSGDSETFQVVFLLHDGAEIRLGEIRSAWAQVLLPEGRQGWVKKEDIEIL